MSGQARNDAASLVRAEDLRRLTAHALVLAEWTLPQPYVIETIILHVKSLLLKYHDTTHEIFQLHGQAMRVCLQAGYHRDPESNPAISPFACEMRRRVWMFACEYDVLTSYQLGMCSMLNWSLFDTKSPANYLDADLSTDYLSQPRPDDEYTPMKFALCYNNLAKIFGDIVRSSHQLASPSIADTASFQTRLNDLRNRFPHKLKMIPLDQSFMDPPELILDRFRLQLLHLKAVCVLYRPFVESGYEEESQCCLNAAGDIVRQCIPLVEAAQSGGQLAGCAVSICRHVHDFNLAAVILCSELKRQSASPSERSPKDRSVQLRPLLLRACLLWSLSGITSPKARHAIRAVQRFLQQESRMVGDYPGMTRGGLTEQQDLKADFDTGGMQPKISSEMPLATGPGNAVFDNPLAEYQAPFNIEQDPMFQDIFGPPYPVQAWT